MELDLTRFLDVPDGWAIRFTANGITEEDAQRGIDAAKSVLSEANLHPFTSFIAYQFLTVEWHEFLAARRHSTELDKWAFVCAWADVWEAAEGAAVNSACGHLPLGEVRYHFHVTFPNAPNHEDQLFIRDDTGSVQSTTNRFSSYLEQPKSSH